MLGRISIFGATSMIVFLVVVLRPNISSSRESQSREAPKPVEVVVSHSHGIGSCWGTLRIDQQGFHYRGTDSNSDRKAREQGLQPSLSSVHRFNISYGEAVVGFIDNTDGHKVGLSNWPWLEFTRGPSFVFLSAKYVADDAQLNTYNGNKTAIAEARMLSSRDFVAARKAYAAFRPK